MPELPEVEHLRRTLVPVLTGARVEHVQLKRKDIFQTQSHNGKPTSRAKQLLAGSTIKDLRRHGKQLAFIANNSIITVQLGMTGQLRFFPQKTRIPKMKHAHCIWSIKNNGTTGKLLFVDPRRFGLLRSYRSLLQLHIENWSRLGPDALRITSRSLAQRLVRTNRSIKAALLDQKVLAGVGNIYADEALFDARIHPESNASYVPKDRVCKLARSIRRILRAAVKAGGSTVRDYVDVNGDSGWFAVSHNVYGRQGQPCVSCKRNLDAIMVSQRTTVFCKHCQTKHA